MSANKPVVQLGKLEVASLARARRPIGLGPGSGLNLSGLVGLERAC